MVIWDSSPGIAREARCAGVRLPAANGGTDLPGSTNRRPRSPILDCAEFAFEPHNARMMLAHFVSRRSWDKV